MQYLMATHLQLIHSYFVPKAWKIVQRFYKGYKVKSWMTVGLNDKQLLLDKLSHIICLFTFINDLIVLLLKCQNWMFG